MSLLKQNMHILFINHHHLDSNSGIHIFNLANKLSEFGVKCTVCVPDQKETASLLGKLNFEIFNLDEIIRFIQPGQVDLIHTWTPRERVRLMTETLTKKFNVPYIVHLEDNEDAIIQSSLDMPLPDLINLPEARLNALIPNHLSHPIYYKQFIQKARGLTMVMDTLQEFGPEVEAKEVIWPGYEEELQWHRPADVSLRQQFQINPDEYVVVYTGNVHHANRQEVFSLYLAVGLLNRRGISTKLIRTGTDYVTLYDDSLNMLNQFCISLGHVPRTDLPGLLSLSDVLVQPGKLDVFNKFRFPSKLPEYFASGKPVLLPNINIGRFIKDGEEGILLQQGNALEIAQQLETLFSNHGRRKKIGNGGRLFAENNLKWSQSAKKLQAFYRHILNAVIEQG